MPQWKLDVTGMTTKEDSKKLIAKGEEVAGVRMVNANYETGVVVVTHAADGFDQAEFKTAIAKLGFNS
uniref:heavy-metal-associated domain-containing protein n=1 Tax=Jeotgalibaca porci TaxID=1868793 RepID=UPI00359F7888